MDNEVTEIDGIPIFELKDLEDTNQLIMAEDFDNDDDSDEQLIRKKYIVTRIQNEEDELQITGETEVESVNVMNLVAIEEVITENSEGARLSPEDMFFDQEEDEHATWEHVKVLLLQLKKVVDNEKKSPCEEATNDDEEEVEIAADNVPEALRDLIRECLEKQPNGKTSIEEDIDKILSPYIVRKKVMKHHQRKLLNFLNDFGY